MDIKESGIIITLPDDATPDAVERARDLVRRRVSARRSEAPVLEPAQPRSTIAPAQPGETPQKVMQDVLRQEDLTRTTAEIGLPLIADIATAYAVPPSAALNMPKWLARVPVLNTLLKRWGPGFVQNLAGGTAGTITARAVGGPEQAGGYAALRTFPYVGAREGGRYMQSALGEFAGGAAGGGLATTLDIAQREGRLPTKGELAVGTILSGAGEGAAARFDLLAESGIGAAGKKVKDRYPQLADIPDAVFSDPQSVQRWFLESFGTDFMFNPALKSKHDDAIRAMQELVEMPVAEGGLGLRSPTEQFLGEQAPSLRPVRSAMDEIIRSHGVRPPVIPPGDIAAVEAGLPSAQVAGETVQVPRPEITVPEVTPGLGKQVGEEITSKLGAFAKSRQAEITKAYGAGLEKLSGMIPDVPLNPEPIQRAVSRARDFERRVIPEGSTGAMRTGENILDVAGPTETTDIFQEIFQEFPGLVNPQSKLSAAEVPALLENISKRRMAAPEGSRKQAQYSMFMGGVLDSLEATEGVPKGTKDFIRDLRTQYRLGKMESVGARRAAVREPTQYATSLENLDMLRGATREMGLMERAGLNPEESARRLIRNRIGADMEAAIQLGDDKKLAKILRDASTHPLMTKEERARWQAQSAGLEAFLGNPKRMREARRLLDIATGKPFNINDPLGKQVTRMEDMTAATEFIDSLPPLAREAVGVESARNILKGSLKEIQPVPGGPSIRILDSDAITNSMSSNPGYIYAPQRVKAQMNGFIQAAIDKSPQTIHENLESIAGTIATLYRANDYSDLAQASAGLFRTAEPSDLRKMKGLFTKSGNDKAWNDWAESQLSTMLFEGERFNPENLVRAFTDVDSGRAVPRESVKILVEHLPEKSQNLLFDLYELAKAGVGELPRGDPGMGGIRKVSSISSAARAEFGLRDLGRLVLGGGSAAGVGYMGMGGKLAGIAVGTAAGLGMTVAVGMAPLLIGSMVMHSPKALNALASAMRAARVAGQSKIQSVSENLQTPVAAQTPQLR